MAYDEGKGYWFFLINHTKLDYIAVTYYCQSNFVEYNYNPITKTNRRKNYAGMGAVKKRSQKLCSSQRYLYLQELCGKMLKKAHASPYPKRRTAF